MVSNSCSGYRFKKINDETKNNKFNDFNIDNENVTGGYYRFRIYIPFEDICLERFSEFCIAVLQWILIHI